MAEIHVDGQVLTGSFMVGLLVFMELYPNLVVGKCKATLHPPTPHPPTPRYLGATDFWKSFQAQTVT